MNQTRRWSGFWICGTVDPAPYLRKSFDLSNVPENAVVHLCGLGWHELYINGIKADDRVLSPAVSQFDKRVSYIDYDITHLLKTGKNVIAVLLGNGLYNDKTPDGWNFANAAWIDKPKMICDLECDGEIVLVSDDSWKAIPSPIIFNQLRSGEHYDARKEIPGMMLPEFHDETWPNASYCNPPGGEIVKEDMEPCRICETIDGEIREFSPSTVIVDFGKNLTGWCEIEVEGSAGSGIMIQYAERLLEDGNITRENISMHVKTKDFQTDRYFLKGNGREIWHPRFVYHGFRYCRIFLWGAVLHRATAHFVHNDFSVRGKFTCSDPLLNRLQAMTCQSYLSNYTGIPTDCPHREKNGWTGDAQLVMETGLWNFSCEKASENFTQILADTQRPSGQLPGIAPTAGFGYNWGSGPAWDIYLFEAPYRIWLYTGDDSAFRRNLPYMEKYLEYCRGMAHDGGLVRFGLGDWVAYDQSHAAPQELTSSAYYYYAAKLISRYKPEYAAVAEKIADAVNRKYYRGNGIYAEGQRTALAAALYFGFAPEPEKTAARLAEAVREKKHLTGFGILGSKYIFRALADHGYADDAVKILMQTDFPSYGYWVKYFDATTLFESWRGSSSQNHIMFGDISAWMYQYLAGITPVESAPGFKHIEFRPCFVKDLDFVEAEHISPFGKICASWKREGEKIHFRCEVPNECTAELFVGKWEKTLSEGIHEDVFEI